MKCIAYIENVIYREEKQRSTDDLSWEYTNYLSLKIMANDKTESFDIRHFAGEKKRASIYQY